MRERQGNVCGICKTPGKPLCVDHCHATGKVRGLLCRDCNLGLGNYKDNPVFTRAATAYLEASRCDDGNHQGAPGEGSIRFHDLVFGMRRRGMRAEAWKLQIQRLFSWILRSEAATGEISRESAGKFRAGHMSPSSLPPELQLNSTPWAEALIGGQAVVGATGHPQEAPGTDEQRPAIPVCR